MHNLVKTLINLDVIHALICSIKIDDWFQNVVITINDDTTKLQCIFEQCFEIDLKHQRNYGKNVNGDKKDFVYTMYDFDVIEEDGLYIFTLCAWPLDGRIVCKNIRIVTFGTEDSSDTDGSIVTQ